MMTTMGTATTEERSTENQMTGKPAIFSVLLPSSVGATLLTGLGLKGANQIESSAMTTNKNRHNVNNVNIQ